MACDRCQSERILEINAKCSDMCSVNFNGVIQSDYVPSDIGLGENEDYVNFDLCLTCGKVQGKFPLIDPNFAVVEEHEE